MARFLQAEQLLVQLHAGPGICRRILLLLVRQDISITEVAMMVGYDDYSYFSRVFKKLEGCSPRAYREKMSL